MSRLLNSYLESTTNFDIKLVKNIQDKENELLSLIEFDEDSNPEPSVNPVSPGSRIDLGFSESHIPSPDISIKSRIKDLEPKKSTSSQDLEPSKFRKTEMSTKLVKSIIDLETSKAPSNTQLEPLKSRINLDPNPDWTFELASFKLECPSPWIYIVTNAHVKTIANRRSLAKDGIKVDIFFRSVQRK